MLTLCSLCLCGSKSFAGAENWPQIYNQGVTAYRSNDFATAATAFEQATASPDRQLQARAFYNLGNTYYRLGAAAEQAEPPAALPTYQKSLRGYESALALAPADEDAQFNREVVKNKIEELAKQQEQEQQQQEQEQQQQQPHEQEQPHEPEKKPDGGPSSREAEQPPAQHQPPEQQPPQEQPGGERQTNQLDKAQARVLLDNLREDERVWNFFPELQPRAGEDKEPEKDW